MNKREDFPSFVPEVEASGQHSLFTFEPTLQPRKKTVHGTTNTADDGIYGWYKYVQDFTGDFAETRIGGMFDESDHIWDPFVGSGTTLIASKKLGIRSSGFDVSPFMVDVVRTKTNWSLDPTFLRSCVDHIESKFGSVGEPRSPEIGSWDEYNKVTEFRDDFEGDPKLRKWMSPFVFKRFHQIIRELDSIENTDARLFFRLAIASELIPASNMVLRPNISYKSKAVIDFPVLASFVERARRMISEYQLLDRGNLTPVHVATGDAKMAAPDNPTGIFTSPPYPNDMEYIHQTRLELTLLQYVDNAKGLTGLKKKMLSSSVKLVYRENDWQKDLALEVPSIAPVYESINETLVGKNWGWNPADMVAHFFGGMRMVLRNWHQCLPVGSTAAIVIGDSAFNGVKVATDLLLSDCAELEGFETKNIDIFRTRWNTKHKEDLRESVVVLKKKGAK